MKKEEIYEIKMNKIADNILDFTISCKGYYRKYPMYLSKETEITEDFFSRKIGEFLSEIKGYKRTFNPSKI